mgnify:CR=1 FL=1
MPMITMEASTVAADTNAVVTGKGTYYGCSVLGAGTSVVKDSLVHASGTIIHNVGLPGEMLAPVGVEFQNGLSVVTAVSVTVFYTRGS